MEPREKYSPLERSNKIHAISLCLLSDAKSSLVFPIGFVRFESFWQMRRSISRRATPASLSSHIVFPSVSIPLVLFGRVSSRSTPLRFSRCDCSHVAPFVFSVSSRSPKYSLQVLHVAAASDWQNSRDEYLHRMDEFITFPSSHQISPIPTCCSYR